MGVGRTVVEEYFAALGSRDAGRVAALFAEDATVHEPVYRKEVRGRSTIAQFVQQSAFAQQYALVSVKEY